MIHSELDYYLLFQDIKDKIKELRLTQKSCPISKKVIQNISKGKQIQLESLLKCLEFVGQDANRYIKNYDVHQMQLIANKVEKVFGIEITKDTRIRTIIYARASFYYLCRKYIRPVPPLSVIGGFVGRDHATVINSLKRFDEYLPHMEETHRRAENHVLSLYGDLPIKKPVYDGMIDKLESTIASLKAENELIKQSINVPKPIEELLILLDSSEIEEFCETRVRHFVKMKLYQRKKNEETYKHLTAI